MAALHEAVHEKEEREMLIDKVATVIATMDWPTERDMDKARDVISVILREMYAGRSLDLSGTDYTERWRDTVRSFALREGIDL